MDSRLLNWSSTYHVTRDREHGHWSRTYHVTRDIEHEQ